MFQIVKMQPGDHPAQLAKLGMRIRSKDSEYHMEQPCQALKNLCCTIYEQRPARCRLFTCQQLRLLASGETTEAAALERITETRALAMQVRGLIIQCGLREDGQALIERFERLTSTPVDANLEPELAAMREDLENLMRRLRQVLNREFRPPPHSA